MIRQRYGVQSADRVNCGKLRIHNFPRKRWEYEENSYYEVIKLTLQVIWFTLTRTFFRVAIQNFGF